MPSLAQIDLVWVSHSGGGVDDDFVSDEQDGLRPGFIGGLGGFDWWGCRFFAGVEGFEVGFYTVLFAKDDVGEHDGGVGIGVGVDGGDFFGWDGGEEADGEGWAVTSDHTCGDEGEVVVGISRVDDGCESDVGGAFDDHLPDAGGDCFDEFAVGPGVESFDEGDGVEELDGGNFGDWVVGLGVHGCFSGQLWGFVFRGCDWMVKESRNCEDEPIDWVALVYFSRTLREGREDEASRVHTDFGFFRSFSLFRTGIFKSD